MSPSYRLEYRLWWLPPWLRCLIYCWFFWTPPVYEPAKWNDNNGIQFNNNCYNYACNLRTNTYAQPGRASGNEYTALQCPEVTAGALSDGLEAVAPGLGPCSGCCHRVALVMAPGYDFHWYRRDADGWWSHKPGGTEARNTDNSGNLISDPRTADRGPYTEFCGFFCVCACDVKIN